MKPVWFVVAVALLAFVVRRRQKLEPTLVVGGLLAAVAAAVYGTGVIHLPNLDKILEDVGQALGPWTYLLVAVLAFGETGAFIGLLVPGETAIIVGGVVAGQGEIDIVALIAIVWACAVAGDVTSFLLGRRLGREFLVKHGPKVHISEGAIEKTEDFLERHGGKAIFLGRFVGLIRAVAPFIVGSSGMSLKRFLPYDVLGAGLWGTAYCILGYLGWRSIDKVLSIAKTGALALGGTIVVVVGIVALVRFLREDDNRAKVGAWVDDKAPFLRHLERPGRWVYHRLTPGELGLEATTLLALAAVGGFVFLGYALYFGEDVTRLTPGDLRGVRWSNDLRADWLDSVAKVVTHLGTLPVAGGALLIVVIGLYLKREVLEASTLLGGMVLVYAGVHLGKNALDRPRPTQALVDSVGSAYPSGHSAYAVAWVAIAVALRRVAPTTPVAAAGVVAALVVAIAVGLTRIYLRAHWFSDVAGGWGLGALGFSICGLAALIVGHMRHHPRPA